ncbi:histone-lysine N-methyltransferase SETMAR [Trichonephila clavipes]|nr:histone-lysine N-methyltransferase SETMAR [Trichonephila clavipes]
MVFCSRQCSSPHSQYRQTVSGREKVVQIEHPPFSPDLNLPDFSLFPRLKLALKRKRFDDIFDIQRNVTRLFNSISKEDFLQRFQDMYIRSQRCIVMGGDYFEGQSRVLSCGYAPLHQRPGLALLANGGVQQQLQTEIEKKII